MNKDKYIMEITSLMNKLSSKIYDMGIDLTDEDKDERITELELVLTCVTQQRDDLAQTGRTLKKQLTEAKRDNLRQRVEDIFFGDAFSESPKAGSPKIIYWALRKKDYIATRISSLIGVDMLIVGKFIESNRARIPLDDLLDWIIEQGVSDE